MKVNDIFIASRNGRGHIDAPFRATEVKKTSVFARSLKGRDWRFYLADGWEFEIWDDKMKEKIEYFRNGLSQGRRGAVG